MILLFFYLWDVITFQLYCYLISLEHNFIIILSLKYDFIVIFIFGIWFYCFLSLRCDYFWFYYHINFFYLILFHFFIIFIEYFIFSVILSLFPSFLFFDQSPTNKILVYLFFIKLLYHKDYNKDNWIRINKNITNIPQYPMKITWKIWYDKYITKYTIKYTMKIQYITKIQYIINKIKENTKKM